MKTKNSIKLIGKRMPFICVNSGARALEKISLIEAENGHIYMLNDVRKGHKEWVVSARAT